MHDKIRFQEGSLLSALLVASGEAAWKKKLNYNPPPNFEYCSPSLIISSRFSFDVFLLSYSHFLHRDFTLKTFQWLRWFNSSHYWYRHLQTSETSSSHACAGVLLRFLVCYQLVLSGRVWNPWQECVEQRWLWLTKVSSVQPAYPKLHILVRKLCTTRFVWLWFGLKSGLWAWSPFGLEWCCFYCWGRVGIARNLWSTEELKIVQLVVYSVTHMLVHVQNLKFLIHNVLTCHGLDVRYMLLHK